jgi:hypothetical protein
MLGFPAILDGNLGKGGLEMDLIGTDQCIQICGREVTVTVWIVESYR